MHGYVCPHFLWGNGLFAFNDVGTVFGEFMLNLPMSQLCSLYLYEKQVFVL